MCAPLPLRWLRALIWTLALALPLQAMAVVSMLGCGPSQPVQEPHHADAVHEHHLHGATGDGHEQEASSPATHQCSSACAACFVGAALPSAVLAVGGSRGAGVLMPAPTVASLDVVAPGLERPPRPVLA
jgi:hypothetical protein